MAYRACVFDLDGTLIDSRLDFRAIKKTLGIPLNEPILEYLAQLPPAQAEEKLATLEAIEVTHARTARLFPGVQEFFAAPPCRHIGILTRNCRQALDIAIQSFPIHTRHALAREDAPAKPDPAGLHWFLDTWQLDPSELIYVGDFRFDIECGKRAKVTTVLFHPDGPPKEDFGADHWISHIDHLRDLPGWAQT